ncbi:uncharacterized protein RBU33_014356 isoform 1-T1 [Hipposideros larvatus]
MSKHVRSQFEWKILVEDPDSSERVDPVAAQQPSDEQAQQDKPPTESQDVTPDQDNEDERAPVVPDPDLETELQGLALLKIGHEGNIKRASFSKLQPIPLPAAVFPGEAVGHQPLDGFSRRLLAAHADCRTLTVVYGSPLQLHCSRRRRWRLMAAQLQVELFFTILAVEGAASLALVWIQTGALLLRAGIPSQLLITRHSSGPRKRFLNGSSDPKCLTA